MSSLVYIVILNYNNYKDTIECIESLKSINYDNFKILILDNNSTDNSAQFLKSQFNDYKIIEFNENLGFAKANNIGIKKALEEGAEYIVLLNNDTIVEKNFLNELIKTAQNNDNIGIVGGKIYYYNDKDYLWHAGGEIDLLKFITVDYGRNSKDSKKNCYEKEVQYVSGCLMLINSEVFKKSIFIPEDYFMYYEDTDFCLKVLENGYKIIYNPNAVIYHKVSMASGGKESPFSLKYNVRNRLIFMNKYKRKVSKRDYFLSVIYFYLTRIMRIIIYLIKLDSSRAKAIYEGMKEGRRYVSSKYNNSLL